MSYQVLARKWRPQRFSQVVGQQHVLAALENGLRAGRLHHAYLFSGTRGVGKTSIARLFAKGLNCEHGVSADPCGECANCKAIEEGRFIDLIEIDAASRTKVEDTRELLDNVQYKPTVGRFKVYLIDEVHMLSRHSFNALLKTLEEPPEYVKFLLATTDPQKLPITILSRCMQFHLRALDQSQIRRHLEQILLQESIPFEPLALDKLAKAAQGSIRDSLSLTDQAIALSNANITLEVVSQMLGLIDEQQPLELVQALAAADGEKAMKVLQRVAEKGVDWSQLLNDVAQTLHQVALLQLLPNSKEEETPLHFLARQIPPEEVQLFYQIMLSGKKELPYAPEPKSGVEMTVLRALAFHPKLISLDPPAAAAVAPASAPSLAAVDTASQQNIALLKAQLTTSSLQQAVENPQKLANSEPPSVAPRPIEAAQPAPPQSAVSAALQAVQARQALKAKQAELTEHEKKKPDLTPPPTAKPAPKSDLQQRLARFSTVEAAETPPKSAVTQPQSSEEYRWTWLDPELENEGEGAKPSEIKQAILQERTPELVKKTIEIGCQQDEWSRIVNQLKLGGISRQLALNSYLTDKQGDMLQLSLRSHMAHLMSDEARQHLTQALQEQGFRYELTIADDRDFKTPLELRRTIFENLTQEAKHALYADEQLQLLRETFDAEIDEASIRPVVSR